MYRLSSYLCRDSWVPCLLYGIAGHTSYVVVWLMLFLTPDRLSHVESIPTKIVSIYVTPSPGRYVSDHEQRGFTEVLNVSNPLWDVTFLNGKTVESPNLLWMNMLFRVFVFYFRVRGVDWLEGEPVPLGLFGTCDLRTGTVLPSSLYGVIWGREKVKSVLLTSHNCNFVSSILPVLSVTPSFCGLIFILDSDTVRY